MSSKSSQLRNQWKESDPEKYKIYLEKQRQRAKERRAAKKEKWENEPHTRAMIAEKEKEREQGRNRMRRLSEKRRSEGRRVLRRSTEGDPGLPTNSKKPKDMTEEERRAHAAELRRQSRARQNPQKKRWAKVKNAEYQRRFREKTKMSSTLNLSMPPVPSPSASVPVFSPAPAVPAPASPVISTTPPIVSSAALELSPVAPAPSPPAHMPSPTAPVVSSPTPTPTPLPASTQSPSLLLNALDLPPTSATPLRPKKTLWNLTSIIKSDLKKKTKNPLEYAQVVKGLATPKTPEKRVALHNIGVQTVAVNKDKLPPKQPALPRPSPAGQTVRRRIRLPSLARARAYRDVQVIIPNFS
ncbi:hypothetical protein ElyMa_003892200 [Elysia marginata]|uniref:HMG box domain-containing protein n=1 Tax=Elysia marginata TaxID=1093978 RepID=A0AAV4FM97_9GAST|nr:hypothetical protein ElyMa_003892200 [Elysia marginata]